MLLTTQVTKLDEPADVVVGAMVTPVAGPVRMFPPAMVTKG